MPCNGGNYFSSRDSHDSCNQAVDDLEKLIHVLTRRLCSACEIIDSIDGAEVPIELDEWWYEHKLADQERMAEAKKRADQQTDELRRKKYLASVKDRVLTQMTDDEKEALGLPVDKKNKKKEM